MVQKYLGLKHEYDTIDCIELLRHFYSNELYLGFPATGRTIPRV